MKSLKLVLVLSLAVVLAACGSDGGNGGNSESSDEEATLKGIVSDGGKALDERAELENIFSKIKEFHKLGFTTEADELQDSEFQYSVQNESILYDITLYPEDVITNINYTAIYNFDEERGYDIFVESSLPNQRDVEHETLDLKSGNYDDGENYEYIYGVENGNILYKISANKEDFSDEMLDLVAKTLKTEEEGAFDLYFTDIKLDLDKLKFPLIDSDKAYLDWISSWNTDYDGYSLSVTYKTEDEYYFEYHIRSKDVSEQNEYEEKGKEKLSDGTEVSVYHSELNQGIDIYVWTDGVHVYEIEHYVKYNPADKEDIIEIIESSLTDDRTFENKALLENTQTEAVLSDDGKKLRELINQID